MRHKEQYQRAFEMLDDVWPKNVTTLPLEDMLIIAEIMAAFARLEIARTKRMQEVKHANVQS